MFFVTLTVRAAQLRRVGPQKTRCKKKPKGSWLQKLSVFGGRLGQLGLTPGPLPERHLTRVLWSFPIFWGDNGRSETCTGVAAAKHAKDCSRFACDTQKRAAPDNKRVGKSFFIVC